MADAYLVVYACRRLSAWDTPALTLRLSAVVALLPGTYTHRMTSPCPYDTIVFEQLNYGIPIYEVNT
jgi:hypothetical protein